MEAIFGSFGIVLIIGYFIGCFALGGWLASEKGYSVGSWVVLLLLFGVLALIVLVGAPDRKGQQPEERKKLLGKNTSSLGGPIGSGSIGSSSVTGKKLKTCKRCHKEMDEDYTACPHCGNTTFD